MLWYLASASRYAFLSLRFFLAYASLFYILFFVLAKKARIPYMCQASLYLKETQPRTNSGLRYQLSFHEKARSALLPHTGPCAMRVIASPSQYQYKHHIRAAPKTLAQGNRSTYSTLPTI